MADKLLASLRPTERRWALAAVLSVVSVETAQTMLADAIAAYEAPDVVAQLLDHVRRVRQRREG